MNTGIQDDYNLGWKLAWVLAGRPSGVSGPTRRSGCRLPPGRWASAPGDTGSCWAIPPRAAQRLRWPRSCASSASATSAARSPATFPIPPAACEPAAAPPTPLPRRRGHPGTARRLLRPALHAAGLRRASCGHPHASCTAVRAAAVVRPGESAASATSSTSTAMPTARTTWTATRSCWSARTATSACSPARHRGGGRRAYLDRLTAGVVARR
ncbi:MAG TPA: hypothetical protein VFL71_00700 [Actinomycetes bacterium]|nr:hypothetical protein [Actinomycetes bacterium]